MYPLHFGMAEGMIADFWCIRAHCFRICSTPITSPQLSLADLTLNGGCRFHVSNLPHHLDFENGVIFRNHLTSATKTATSSLVLSSKLRCIGVGIPNAGSYLGQRLWFLPRDSKIHAWYENVLIYPSPCNRFPVLAMQSSSPPLH